MSFDYVAFFERRGISYVTQGPNVGRGEIGIKCPFCGPADPSEHMSVNLEGRGWVCRRARGEGHRGRSPIRLIRALTGCSAQEAARIVGAPLLLGTPDWYSEVSKLLGPLSSEAPAEAAPRRELREPREFKRFEGLPSERPYMRYMRGRGFSREFVRRASAEMGLRYCTRGPFAGRVIFLIYQEGRLVSWTGRAISPRAASRYRAHTVAPDLAASWGVDPAALSIERCLLWSDELAAGGPLLELVEGPMDALKLRSLGHSATCLFTNVLSEEQFDLLRELAPRFKRRVILLDRGAEAQALLMASQLYSLGFRVAWLPKGATDPGELTETLIDQIRY